MQALNVLLLFCFIAITYGFPETQIVGGKNAPIGKFPYQVSLRKNGEHFCGGSIINSRYILTAAHCVKDLKSKKNVTVATGTNFLDKTGVSYEVEQIAIHKNFSFATDANDIALIRVKKNIAFTNLVKTIPLAKNGSVAVGTTCTLSGWGIPGLGANYSNKLQYINLRVVKQSKCKERYPYVTNSHICTFTKYGEGACVGDSGGPLVLEGVQIGIVSFNRNCGFGYPDVFTKVSSFNSWIKKQQTYLQNEEEQPTDTVYIA